MIASILAAPNIPALTAAFVADEVGMPLGIMFGRNFRVRKPARRAYFGPIRLVYVHTLNTLNYYLEPLQKSDFLHVVIVNDALSVFEEHGLQLTYSFDRNDLLHFIEKAKPGQVQPFTKKRDFGSEIFDKYNKGSVLKVIQSSFYRIKNKELRARVQLKVFNFLGSKTSKPPTTEIAILNSTLRSEMVESFRKAVTLARTHGIDEASARFNVDRFEVQYVMLRCGYL